MKPTAKQFTKITSQNTNGRYVFYRMGQLNIYIKYKCLVFIYGFKGLSQMNFFCL